jgi:hypothetical protein
MNTSISPRDLLPRSRSWPEQGVLCVNVTAFLYHGIGSESTPLFFSAPVERNILISVLYKGFAEIILWMRLAHFWRAIMSKCIDKSKREKGNNSRFRNALFDSYYLKREEVQTPSSCWRNKLPKSPMKEMHLPTVCVWNTHTRGHSSRAKVKILLRVLQKSRWSRKYLEQQGRCIQVRTIQ